METKYPKHKFESGAKVRLNDQVVPFAADPMGWSKIDGKHQCVYSLHPLTKAGKIDKRSWGKLYSDNVIRYVAESRLELVKEIEQI